MSLLYWQALLTVFVLWAAVALIQGNETECLPGDIGLFNRTSPLEGRVYICSMRKDWRGLCNTSGSFGKEEMNVTCRELGFLPYGKPGEPIDGTLGTTFLVTNVECHGNEQYLAECNYRLTFGNSCDKKAPVVRCYKASPPKEVCAKSSQTSTIISWTEPEGNDTNINVSELVEEYIIECFVQVRNLHHDVSCTVKNSVRTVTLSGLHPDKTYNCCVTAVFSEKYRTKDCAITMASSSLTTTLSSSAPCSVSHNATSLEDSCNTNIVGGVLGTMVIVLLGLLVLMVAALVYVLFRRQNGISTRKNLSKNPDNTMENPTYSGTELPHKNTNQTDGGHNPTITQYGSLGPAYETLDSVQVPPPQRQGNQNTNTNQTPLAEHYEFTEIHHDTDATSGNGMRYKQLKPEDAPNQGTAEYETLNHDTGSKMSQATKADNKVANDDTKAKRPHLQQPG